MDVDSVLNEWTCYKNYILYIIWLDTRNWNRWSPNKFSIFNGPVTEEWTNLL